MNVEHNLKTFIATLVLTTIICYSWCGIEYLIEGAVVNRTVDNIIMSLFVLIIYKMFDYKFKLKDLKEEV